jgi:DNA-binding GntR family transcriptional regulator
VIALAAIAEARALTDPTWSPRLVRTDLNEQAYQWVRERLLARHFGPGEKLGLQALADELGVSRSPVHQALTRLVSEGLVTATRGRGYRVRPLTPRLMAETHDARAALELYAVEETIGMVGPDSLTALRRALARTIEPVRDGELVDLPGNAVVSEMYRRLNAHRLMERAYLSLDVSEAGNSSAEHTEIVAAIEAGDLQRARAAVRANAETGKRLATKAIELAGGVL